MRWLTLGAALALVSACSGGRGRADTCVHGSGTEVPLAPGQRSLKTVFIVVMENKNWSRIGGNPSAQYINASLLPAASYATQYFNPPGNHPSEPNYLWLEGGTSYGIHDDADPASHHLSNKDHLVSLLAQAGISWKAYQEGIDGKECPLVSHGLYAAKHNPLMFFDDVTSGNDPNSAACISHVRPLQELATDLQSASVARYNFITPDLCNDMHNSSGCPTSDSVGNGDNWLSQWVPRILQSAAYRDGGVLFILWDESEDDNDAAALIALSPVAKGGGYSNSIHYTHSSMLRTLQEIFGVGPLLCDAANAADLSDLFRAFP